MEDAVVVREAMSIVPRIEITVLREGLKSQLTENQKRYQQSRANLFKPYRSLDADAIRVAIEARRDELEEAILNSPLKGASDRAGNSLGNLKELTSMALRELSGELKSKTVLGRTLEMITDEEEQRVLGDARENTREGLVIDRESGSIQIRRFSDESRRQIAEAESSGMREKFQKGKDRMLSYVGALGENR